MQANGLASRIFHIALTELLQSKRSHGGSLKWKAPHDQDQQRKWKKYIQLPAITKWVQRKCSFVFTNLFMNAMCANKHRSCWRCHIQAIKRKTVQAKVERSNQLLIVLL